MTVLKLGSRGAAVKELQRLLNAAGAAPVLLVDGKFQTKTDIAVRVFQRLNGLVDDGKVGTQTRTALKQATTPAKLGRAEPDKSAIVQPPPSAAVGDDTPRAPPNAASLEAFFRMLASTARGIDEVIWHCAATPEGKDFTVADIRAWHKARGWSDIGYHIVVYRDGSVHVGRPIGQQGAHCADHGKNGGTAGAVYIGGVSKDGKTPKDTRTPAQRSSMLWMTREMRRRRASIKRVTGHNQYSSKACPSFDVRKDALAKIA